MAGIDRTAASLIAEVRRASGLSQAELARRSGMTRSVINAYEHGARQPGVDALQRIVTAGGMQLELGPRQEKIDPRRAGRLLTQVLELAEALPFRAGGKLEFPGLPPAAA